jgi:hypothetical protein
MANGWSPERKARQAALIRGWRPWEKSTGPTSHAGKSIAARNSFKHGEYSAETIDLFAKLRLYRRMIGAKKLKRI